MIFILEEKIDLRETQRSWEVSITLREQKSPPTTRRKPKYIDSVDFRSRNVSLTSKDQTEHAGKYYSNDSS